MKEPLLPENKPLTLHNMQEMVDEWIEDIGIRYFHPLTNMAILTEEVGELARVISRKHGEQSYKESDKTYSLEEELSDILWVILCIANQHKIDFEKEFLKNINKKTQRDSQRHAQNQQLKKPFNPFAPKEEATGNE